MNRSHVFGSSRSLAANLSAGGLLIIASSRLAYALTITGALCWVYCLLTLALYPARRFFPRRGKSLILVLLSSLAACVYLLLLWFANPLMALEVFFPVSLVSLFCAHSALFGWTEPRQPYSAGSHDQRIADPSSPAMGLADLSSAMIKALSEAAIIGGAIIAFSIIREPLGLASLSLPGSSQGIVLLFSFEDGSFVPVRLFASSAGALLLFGYGVGLYRYFKKIYASGEDAL